MASTPSELGSTTISSNSKATMKPLMTPSKDLKSAQAECVLSGRELSVILKLTAFTDYCTILGTQISQFDPKRGPGVAIAQSFALDVLSLRQLVVESFRYGFLV